MRIFGKEISTTMIVAVVLLLAAIGCGIWYWTTQKDTPQSIAAAKAAADKAIAEKAGASSVSTGTVQVGTKKGFAMSGIGLVFPN